jgi:polyhydroxybutyrate depolymerase
LIRYRHLPPLGLLLLATWGGLQGYFAQSSPSSKSALAGDYRENVVVCSGGIDRSFSYYLPSTHKEGAALVFVLYGSISSGKAIRKMTGNEFDLLAETNHYITVYANGFENHWNDCRASADYSANTQDIDDIAHIAFF